MELLSVELADAAQSCLEPDRRAKVERWAERAEMLEAALGTRLEATGEPTAAGQEWACEQAEDPLVAQGADLCPYRGGQGAGWLAGYYAALSGSDREANPWRGRGTQARMVPGTVGERAVILERTWDEGWRRFMQLEQRLPLEEVA